MWLWVAPRQQKKQKAEDRGEAEGLSASGDVGRDGATPRYQPAGTYCVWRRRKSGLPCESCFLYLRAEDMRGDLGRFCLLPG